MFTLKKSSRGFTIVELLIVIVVIAILASISVVAYNGIQTRAENTKTAAAISQYIKALQAYKSEEGSYPLTAASVFKYKCVGDATATCGMVSGTFTAGECDGLGGVSNSTAAPADIADVTTLNNAVKRYGSAIPITSQQTMTCENRDMKGAIYFAVNTSAIIYYYLKGNVPCSQVDGVTTADRFFAPNTKRCIITLP